jgi:hypothetical protein
MADPNETTNLVNEITGTGGAHAAAEGGPIRAQTIQRKKQRLGSRPGNGDLPAEVARVLEEFSVGETFLLAAQDLRL